MSDQNTVQDAVERVIADFQRREIRPSTPRSCRLRSLPGKVDAVVGMRRSGKTTFLLQQVQRLEGEGVPRSRMLYVNFEDERLLPLSVSDLHRFPDTLLRRDPEAAGHAWYGFDEIQNVTGWETFVRRLMDEGRSEVVVTGSSAVLMAREVATSLRGRSLPTEILPFGFREFLEHRGIRPSGPFPPASAERAVLEQHVTRYLEVGGFPEVQGFSEEDRVATLRAYVDVVLFRDVVERHGVANVTPLRHLVRRLAASPAGLLSVNKLYNDLRSQQIAVGKNTLHEYLSLLEAAGFVFPVAAYAASEQARATRPRKCYLVDPALGRTGAHHASPDVGHLLENAVYLELRRRGWQAAFVVTRSGWEVDLVATQAGRRPLLVQVCADLSTESTRAREVRALGEAMEELSVEDAVVVTLLDRGELRVGSRTVPVMPAWWWFLEEG